MRWKDGDTKKNHEEWLVKTKNLECKRNGDKNCIEMQEKTHNITIKSRKSNKIELRLEMGKPQNLLL